MPIDGTMSIWTWLAIGTTAFIGVPAVIGLGVGRILGQITHEVTELLEAEEWNGAPLTRALDDPRTIDISAAAAT